MLSLKEINNMSLKEIENLVSHNQKLYWENGSSDITDEEYDILLKQLEKLDKNNQLLNNIEHNSNKVMEYEHDIPMLSLDKVFTYSEIIKWMDKYKRTNDEVFRIEPKLDGIAAKFYYKENLFITRGDGLTGENISKLLPITDFKTKKDVFKENVIGELVITNTDFNSHNVKTKSNEKYKTPRNMISGISNLKNIDHLKDKVRLTFIDYDILSVKVKYNEFNENILNMAIEKWKDHYDYPTDGLVFKLDDENYSNKLGNTSKFPYGKISYKFKDTSVKTKLLNVEWNNGKSKLTPLAILEPVVINNTTIKKATLHNAQFIIDNDLKINDYLEIVKSGDIIPKVINTIKEENSELRKDIKIQYCPDCGDKLYYDEPNLYCQNPNCIGIGYNQLVYGLKTLGAENIGDKTIKKIIEGYDIENLADFFNIEYNDLIYLENIKEKSSENIENSIESIIKTPIEDYKVLASINIPGIGKTISKKILKKYSINEVFNLSIDNLCKIEGISHTRAVVINQSIKTKKEVLKDLLKILNVKHTKDTSNNDNKICFSGSFPKPKKFYEEIAVQNNFEITSNYTKNLSLLICDDKSTSKYHKAIKDNVKTMTSEEFLTKFK